MVGSSWKAADSSGEAPIRSPAATVIVLSSSCCSASWASWVARYAEPPAGTLTGVPSGLVPVRIWPLDPLGGSRAPCKSLRASSCTSTGGPPFGASPERPAAAAAELAAATASPAIVVVTAAATVARRTVGRIVPPEDGPDRSGTNRLYV